MVKANAYGHGLERIAKALPQADAFGVARIDEALALRAGGVVKPIVLLEGFFEAQDLPAFFEFLNLKASRVIDRKTQAHQLKRPQSLRSAYPSRLQHRIPTHQKHQRAHHWIKARKT